MHVIRKIVVASSPVFICGYLTRSDLSRQRVTYARRIQMIHCDIVESSLYVTELNTSRQN